MDLDRLNDILTNVLECFYIYNLEIDTEQEKNNIYLIEFKHESFSAKLRIILEERAVVNIIYFHSEGNSFAKDLKFVSCFQKNLMEELFFDGIY